MQDHCQTGLVAVTWVFMLRMFDLFDLGDRRLVYDDACDDVTMTRCRHVTKGRHLLSIAKKKIRSFALMTTPPTRTRCRDLGGGRSAQGWTPQRIEVPGGRPCHRTVLKAAHVAEDVAFLLGLQVGKDKVFSVDFFAVKPALFQNMGRGDVFSVADCF